MVLENLGPAAGFRDIDGFEFSNDLPKSRDILADKPGRTFDSVGAGRHAKENTADPHRERKRDFAAQLIGTLRRAMLARQFDRLVLVAPAQFIGDLRDELPKDLKAKIDREITGRLDQDAKAPAP
jgi:protein required for attachment to host cells